MPVFHTDVVMIDFSEFNHAMSMTSDRVFACVRAIVDDYVSGIVSLRVSINTFYRKLYYTGVIDTPIHTHHPMTARKMRGVIRRLKAGVIDGRAN